MKFAALIEYIQDKEKIQSFHAAHRLYLRDLLDSGQLVAAGPLTNDSGALWVFDAETAVKAEEIIKGDPFCAAGVFVNWHIHSLAYWSAKACKGEK